jgi:hypothetical protein
MEIKLKTTQSAEDTWTIVDEYGARWNLAKPKPVHGIFLASTKGRHGEAVNGYYQNGTLFIVNFNEAQKYFASTNVKRARAMHHM